MTLGNDFNFFTIAFAKEQRKRSQEVLYPFTVALNTVSPNILCFPKHIDSKKDQWPPGSSFILMIPPALPHNSGIH